MNTYYQLKRGKNQLNHLIITCFVFMFFLSASAQQWEYLGDQGGVSAGGSSYQSIAKDVAGNIYISYYDVVATKGSVQKYNGTSWSYAGGSAGITAQYATYNSLSADALGNIYHTSQGSGMEVRKFDGTAWTSLPALTSSTVNFQASVVTASGVLVAANNTGSGTVKRYVNGAWEQIGSAGFAGGTPFYLDMVTGTDNTIYVSYVSNGNIYVIKNDINAPETQSWSHVGGLEGIAPATSSEQFRAAMAVDANNNIFIAYTSVTSAGNKLNVKKYNGLVWAQVGADNFTDYRVHYVNIAANASGVPYVVFSNYENSPNNGNQVMKFNGSSWEAVGSNPVSAGEAKGNVILFDNAGNPVIAYADSSTGKTMVRRFVENPTLTPVQSVTVTTQNNAAAQITQNAGTLQLVASILPAAAGQGVTWAITQGLEFATINENGLVTATANGTVTVTATSVQDATKTGTITITISNQVITGDLITGFNRDIIANGVGNASDSSELGLDEVNTRALVSLDFKANANSAAPTRGLPANGVISSANTAGVVYQLANYTGPNALYLTPSYVTGSINTVNSGTLSFQAQNKAKVYILYTAAGGGSSSLTYSATVNFSDGTSQASTLTANDWYSGSGFAIKGIGRVNRANNNLEGDAENPRLYESVITLDTANQTKTITGVSFTFAGDASAEYGDQIRLAILSVATGEATSTPPESAISVVTSNNGPAVITENSAEIDFDAYMGDDYVGENIITWSIVPGTGNANVDQYGKVTAVSNGTVMVRATLISDPSVYGELELTISGQVAGYCEVYFINGCSPASISNFYTTGGFPNISNTSSGCLSSNDLSGYSDYTSTVLGATRNTTVTFNFEFTSEAAYAPFLSAWIDWNHDFIFQDSERVFVSQDQETDNYVQFTATVPANAALGQTRMRFKAVGGWLGSGACGYNSFGEIEDYTITILDQGIAPAVTIVTQNDVPAAITTNDGTLQLVANVTPTPAPVLWSVIAGNVYGSVSADGLVTALNNGTITVRARLASDTSVYDDIEVTISSQIILVESLTVSTLDNVPAAITTTDGIIQLVATILPVNADNSNVTWTITEGAAFATVSSTGLVTATANGTVTVKATSVENDEVFDDIEIEISNQYVAVTGITVSVKDAAAASITTNEGTLQLATVIAPVDALNKEVTWTIVSGSEFATVDANGLVTASANGTVTVRATSQDNDTLYDEIDIVISNQHIAVTAIAVSVKDNAAATITTNEGTLQLEAAITPNDATNSDVTWSIAIGSEFATVDANGLVTAIASGTVTVRATSVDTTTLFDEIEVVISNQYVAVTALTVSVKDDAAAVITTAEGTLQLEATIVPADATNADVTWSIVSGSEFATVNANGLVTAIANGTVTIRATSVDTTTLFDEIEVVISNQYVAVTALTVSVKDDAAAVITTAEGTLQLEATIVPVDATNADVTWTIVSGSEFATVDANGLVTAIANGTVTVRATSEDDATLFDDIEILISGQTLGNDDFETSKFAMYPNPSHGELTISSSKTVQQVVIFNMIGQKVYEGKGSTIDLSGKEDGVYLVQATFEDGAVTTQKLIKK